MSSIYIGRKLRLSIFGQSHSAGIGAVLDGLPAGFTPDPYELQSFMERRAPGRNRMSTARREADAPEILSGLAGGTTCGAPLSFVIRNGDVRSGDYDEIRDRPRPSHADYPAYVKHGGFADAAGGGHFSARLTAPLCAAGGILIQYLRSRGVTLAAHLDSIGAVHDRRFDPASVDADSLLSLLSKKFPVLDDAAGTAMADEIESARLAADSVGGTVEFAAVGLPAGLGEPMFDGIENRLSAAIFAIPAVRGIEFGAGFSASSMRGSDHNDPYEISNGKIRTRTNNHGGVLGGLTSGMPLIFRTAFKPTPSIGIEQDTVSLSSMENTKLTIRGRHDPCVAVRAVPCVEAAAALVLADFMI